MHKQLHGEITWFVTQSFNYLDKSCFRSANYIETGDRQELGQAFPWNESELVYRNVTSLNLRSELTSCRSRTYWIMKRFFLLVKHTREPALSLESQIDDACNRRTGTFSTLSHLSWLPTVTIDSKIPRRNFLGCAYVLDRTTPEETPVFLLPFFVFLHLSDRGWLWHGLLDVYWLRHNLLEMHVRCV